MAKKSKRKFAAFILSHGRADRQDTLKSLEKGNYTGDCFIIIDNEDATAPEYFRRYGDKVIQFNKSEWIEKSDSCDNFSQTNSVIYARNACFEIAAKMGYSHFLQLDDDYTTFSYKFDPKMGYKEQRILSLDKIFDLMCDFLDSVPCKAIAIAQNGDFIGGGEGAYSKKFMLTRKCMNTFFCSTEKDRRFRFFGRVNEDVNAYTKWGNIGDVFFTFNGLAIAQRQTQSNTGGLTDIYLDKGTFVKSFYSVMAMPSAVKVGLMGDKNMRLHHKINWRKCVPVILEERNKRK